MTRGLTWAGLVLLVALIATGCERGPDRSKMTTAPADGQYQLYLSGNSLPQMTADLKRGDPIGFEREGSDVYVVLGTKRQKSHPNRVRQLIIMGDNGRLELRP
jgi:hypothetical protein